ncbi:MAG: YiiX/YebB-like N1pC/P60 family cysteine hydrolase [Aequorivita sp.]
MQFKKLIKFLVIGSILILVFSFFYQKEKILINDNDKHNIEQFDVILSSGQSFQSKLLNLFNISVQSYSHIGLILKENNKIYILHSTPDGTEDNGIRYDNFQEFIDLSNVNYYRILRLDSLGEYQNIEKSIKHFKETKIPFDYDFDNIDKHKIYCSELVFDIFNDNKLIKTKLDLSKPIHPKEFVKMTEFRTIKERKTTQQW